MAWPDSYFLLDDTKTPTRQLRHRLSSYLSNGFRQKIKLNGTTNAAHAQSTRPAYYPCASNYRFCKSSADGVFQEPQTAIFCPVFTPNNGQTGGQTLGILSCQNVFPHLLEDPVGENTRDWNVSAARPLFDIPIPILRHKSDLGYPLLTETPVASTKSRWLHTAKCSCFKTEQNIPTTQESNHRWFVDLIPCLTFTQTKNCGWYQVKIRI